jgi:hypothetical protein
MNKDIATSMHAQNTHTFLLIRDFNWVRLAVEVTGLLKGEAEIT